MELCLESVNQVISCGLFLANSELSVEENIWLYGTDYSPKGMGFNFSLRVFFVSSNLPSQKKLDQLKDILKTFDHSILNEKNSRLKTPTIENLLLVLREQLKASGLLWERIEITHAKSQKVIGFAYSDQVIYVKHFRFSSLHRHHNPQLTMEENRELFGKCSGVHGHEYELEVFCKGAVNDHGVVVPRKKLDLEVQERTIAPLKGKFLNDIFGNTSGELILQKINERFSHKSFSDLEVNFKLNETRKNSFFSSNAILF